MNSGPYSFNLDDLKHVAGHTLICALCVFAALLWGHKPSLEIVQDSAWTALTFSCAISAWRWLKDNNVNPPGAVPPG